MKQWKAWVIADQKGHIENNGRGRRWPILWSKADAHLLAKEMTEEAASGHPHYRSRQMKFHAVPVTLSTGETHGP